MGAAWLRLEMCKLDGRKTPNAEILELKNRARECAVTSLENAMALFAKAGLSEGVATEKMIGIAKAALLYARKSYKSDRVAYHKFSALTAVFTLRLISRKAAGHDPRQQGD